MNIGNDPLSAASTHFALRLLQRTAKQSRGSNVVLAPIGMFQTISVFAFLSPVPIGREIRKELRLGIHSETDPSLLARYVRLGADLNADTAAGDLCLTTSFWTGLRVPAHTGLYALARSWGIEVFAIDRVTVDRMEEWSAAKIPGLVSAVLPLPSADGAVAINAAIVRPAWQAAFPPGHTMDRPFQRPSGPPQPTPTMRIADADARVYHGTRYDAARIPLAGARGGRSLHVVLPRRATLAAQGGGNQITPFVEQFTGDDWAQCKAGYRPTRLDLMLPRLELEQQYDLRKTLLTMGFDRAYDGAGRIAPFAPAIDNSIVQICLQFFEGEAPPPDTKTSVVKPAVGGYPAIQPGIEPFHVDRPFVFLVTDDLNDLILFAGVIQDP